MNETGFVYVPSACAAGATCNVHVVFHGCNQTIEQIGNAFYTRTGYNEWADTNNLLILYPQTKQNSAQSNSGGCWDIWGLDDPNYHTKQGRQMLAIKGMIDRLSGGTTGGPGPDPDPADTTPPAIPAGVSVSAPTSTSLTVSWTANNEADLLGYNVYQATSATGTFTKRNSAPVTGTSFVAGGLSSGATFFFKVSSLDDASNESAQSAAASGTTSAAAPFCQSFTSSNYAHVQAGRGVLCARLTPTSARSAPA